MLSVVCCKAEGRDEIRFDSQVLYVPKLLVIKGF